MEEEYKQEENNLEILEKLYQIIEDTEKKIQILKQNKK